jgi:glycosyltransferase involved in cell wall biosynthesis
MKISLITVCRNAAATIEHTLRSVAAQDHADLEYLVRDGASQDGTQQLVSGFMADHPEVPIRFVSEPDDGLYAAANQAIRIATGEIVGMLNADDFFPATDVLSRIARAFQDPAVDCVFGDLDFVSATDPAHVVRRWRSATYEPGASLRGWHPPHPTLYVRRALMLRMGGFNERYPVVADVEFMARLFEIEHARSRHIPAVLVHMRAGGMSNGSLRKHVVANWQCWRAARRAGLPVSPLYMVRKPLSRLHQFFVRDHGAERVASPREG